jgi:hypothetical protein
LEFNKEGVRVGRSDVFSGVLLCRQPPRNSGRQLHLHGISIGRDPAASQGQRVPHRGMEQVLRSPGLVFSEQGTVRPEYGDYVDSWQRRNSFLSEADGARECVEESLRIIEKRLKRSRRKLTKVLKSMTKKAAKLTDLHR